MRYFIIVIILYFGILGCEIALGHNYIKDTYKNDPTRGIDTNKAYFVFFVEYAIIVAFILLLGTFYMYRLKRILQEMRNFHIFLTTYR